MSPLLHKFKIAAGASILALSLVACGETTTSSTSTPEASVPTPPPAPVVPEKWNSDNKKAELEASIKEGMQSTFTGAEQAAVQSVSCTATETEAFWHCNIRQLGDSEPVLYKIEVSADGGWAGQPIF